MLSVLIVDDEAPARQRLTRLLGAFAGEVRLVGEATNGLEALEKIEAEAPDLVFLDIEMPELDGLSVARVLRQGETHVVFATAFDEHALKAFELAAVDYLVKPISETRLRLCIEKILRLQREKRTQSLQPLLTSLGAATAMRHAVRVGSKYVVIDAAKLSAVIARNHYSALIFEGKELLSDESLEEWSRRLAEPRFLRVHRSALINLDFLKELVREGDRKFSAVLADSGATRVPIGRERLNEVKSRLGLSED